MSITVASKVFPVYWHKFPWHTLCTRPLCKFPLLSLPGLFKYRASACSHIQRTLQDTFSALHIGPHTWRIWITPPENLEQTWWSVLVQHIRKTTYRLVLKQNECLFLPSGNKCVLHLESIGPIHSESTTYFISQLCPVSTIMPLICLSQLFGIEMQRH